MPCCPEENVMDWSTRSEQMETHSSSNVYQSVGSRMLDLSARSEGYYMPTRHTMDRRASERNYMNGGQQDRRSHSHIYTELPPPYTKPGKMKQRGTAPSFNLNTSELMEIQKAAARVSNVPSPEMTSFVIKTPCLRRSTINLIPGTYHQVLNNQQDEP